jgi:hypothetical protein
MEHIVRISAKDNALSKRDQPPTGKILAQIFSLHVLMALRSMIVFRKNGRSKSRSAPASRWEANNLKFAARKLRTLVIELGVLILV